ncbi:MAG: tetratricopeptide repeat protein [Chthoniobacterales bacterium]
MKIRKIAAITLLVISSFAANGVAPSKAELEAMYDKAFRDFDATNYAEALKGLDAIDARQPDLAESQNLRGVILMRQKDYANAEKALGKALAADPKFWNARFNLAEIPFLEKKWPEARKRFQELLDGNASELHGEATQLIQYKVLITYLMEGKDDMVSALIAKFELSPETPAVQYAAAAIALHKKNEKEAKDALAAAEKNFSPQLNKLFAESLYEVGWLEKPAGQTRAALELNTQAERAAQAKAFAKAKFDEAEQALQQRDLTAARKLIDEADAADPNQAAIINLRGEILLQQKEFEQAENEFRKAEKADPTFRDAQYNLAQVPFKQQDYATARDRFEALFASTAGTDKDRAAQLIKFKIYMTLLLEGKDTRAQKMMEQFQFTGDTPALYYAQAAWEYKHDNPSKANDWVMSARKIYPLALNGVFADSFFDLGWLQAPGTETTTVAAAENAQPEVAPSIEPTPIPAMTLAQNAPVPTGDPLTLAAKSNPPIAGMEATASDATGAATASSALAAASPSVETPVASRSVAANVPAPVAAATVAVAAVSASPATVLAPATVRRDWYEPTWSERLEQMGIGTVVLIFLLAGLLLITWVMVSIFRRRFSKATPAPELGASAMGAADFDTVDSVGTVNELTSRGRLAGGPPQVSLQLRASEPALRRSVMPLTKAGFATGHGPAHEAVVVPAPVPESTFVSPEPYAAPAMASFQEGIGDPIAAIADEPAPIEASFAEAPAVPRADEHDFAVFKPEIAEPAAEAAYVSEEPAFISAEPAFANDETFLTDDEELAIDDLDLPSVEGSFTDEEPALVADEAPSVSEEPVLAEESAFAAEEAISADDDMVFANDDAFLAPEPVAPELADADFTTADDFTTAEDFATTEDFTAAEDFAAEELEPAMDEMPAELEPVMETPAEESLAVASFEPAMEDLEPIGQGQPVPYLTPAPAPKISQPEPETAWEQSAAAAALGAGLAGIGALRHSVAPSPAFEDVSNEPMAQQPTTPVMPQPTQPTPAPRPASSPTAQPGGAPSAGQQMPGGMHTAVQLTLSFEIASLQLTPSFKMGALQLKPTSKVVTMRLAPSQNPAPAMNLQVTFEIASVQLSGNSIGTIRLTPSQQQRPGISSSPAFNVAGLQLVSGAESAPVQITPSQQGQASVHVTAAFQIATVEFSPSFEIASIVLNSSSRNVSVQLPGSGPSAVEGAPVFEISSVQLGGNGEISTMQLNPQGGAAKRA